MDCVYIAFSYSNFAIELESSSLNAISFSGFCIRPVSKLLTDVAMRHYLGAREERPKELADEVVGSMNSLRMEHNEKTAL